MSQSRRAHPAARFAALAFATMTTATSVVEASGEVPLELSGTSHVLFGSSPPTLYQNRGSALTMRVRRSASFLLIPFERARRVRSVRATWKAKGIRNVATAAAEETRAGDDHWLRIGLLLEGASPTIPLLAPAWLKALRGKLSVQSNRMLCLVSGSRHPDGAKWMSPHTDTIEYRALKDASDGKGHTVSSLFLEQSARVVGLWLMADGDDSASEFVTTLESLRLE